MSQLKYWNGTAWVDAVIGAQGTTGSDGSQGLTGTQGLTGIQGTQGILGLQGTAGNPSTPNVELTAPTEIASIQGSAPASTQNIDFITSGQWVFTSNAANNTTINIRGNSGTTLSSLLSVGESATVDVAITNGSTAYYVTAVQVDGSAVTPKWSGGTAPSAGNASATDIYSFTILKTASTPTYLVLAAGPVKYA